LINVRPTPQKERRLLIDSCFLVGWRENEASKVCLSKGKTLSRIFLDPGITRNDDPSITLVVTQHLYPLNVWSMPTAM